MTASGVTNMNVYPQEDDEKNPVWTRSALHLEKLVLTPISSPQSMVTVAIWTTRPFQYRRCPNELLLVNYHGAST